jgi:choline dehydrogenase-like flavoprotein
VSAPPTVAVTSPTRRSTLRTTLTAATRATLTAAVRRVVIDGYDDLSARVEDRIASLPAHKQEEVRAGLTLFGSRIASLISVGRLAPFHTLQPAVQDAMLHAWGDSVVPQARTLFQLLRRLTLVTHYADVRSHTTIGYRGALHTREPAVAWEGPAVESPADEATRSPIARANAKWRAPVASSTIPAGVVTASTVGARPETSADVIVIGSGAGGAVAAARFAEAGKRVIILEAGEFVTSDQFTEHEGDMTARLYAEGGLRATDDLAVSMMQGAAVGGGTTINWMIMLRTPEHVLEEWSTRFGLEGMRAPDMAPVFERIEHEVHAACVPDDAHSPNNRIILDGAATLGWRAASALINARGCVRSGFCGQGCRYDAKQGTQQTYLPRALANGAVLFANARAIRIDGGGRASGSAGLMPTKRVTAHITSPESGAPPREIVFEAPIIVVSAGAVETPLLLQRSGLGGGGIGSYLRLHPTTAIIGVHEREIYGAAGIPLSAMCDEFLQRDAQGYGFWLECPPLHPSIGSAAIQGFGAAHSAVMRQFPHLASTIALVRDGSDLEQSNGSVRTDRHGRARIAYALGAADRANMIAAMEAAAVLQFAAGAREVHTLHTKPLVLRSAAEIGQIRTRAIDANRLAVFSAHVNGTCRLGTDPQISGVRPTGEVHTARGVYVFDGSMLPTGVGVNPQETIMAMTTVLAERLLSQWPA